MRLLKTISRDEKVYQITEGEAYDPSFSDHCS